MRAPTARGRFQPSRSGCAFEMRIGGAETAPPPSQTGRALLTHPAFRSVVWCPRSTRNQQLRGGQRERFRVGSLPLPWTQFPKPSIGLGLTGPRLFTVGWSALRHSPNHFVRPVSFPFHHIPTPLGSTIITRFLATTGALTPADLFPTVHRGSLIHVTLTSFHAISNHLCPSSSRDPLPLRCGLYFVWTSSFLRRLVTDTGRIEFTLRRTLPSRRYGLDVLFQLLSTRGYRPDAVTFRYWPYSVSQVGDSHPAVRMRFQAHVGTTGCPVAPLSEPDRRISHPALWMIFHIANINCGSEAAGTLGRLCLAHSPASDFRFLLNHAKL